MTAQPGLCRTWSETPKTGFLTTRLELSHGTVVVKIAAIQAKADPAGFQFLTAFSNVKFGETSDYLRVIDVSGT